MTLEAGELAAAGIADIRDIAEALPAMVAVSDVRGRILFVNRRWLDYTGLTFEELSGDRRRFVHPDDYDRVLAARDRSVGLGEPFELDYRIRRHDGVYRWHVWRATPVRDEGGRITSWIGTTTDVHEYKRSADTLAAAEARYRMLSNALPALVVTAMPDGTVVHFNERWYEYTGTTPETARDDQIPEFFHPDEREQVLQRWRDAVRTGVPYDIELRLRRHDGAYRWHYGHVQPFRDQAGRVTAWVSTNIDIDDRRRAEESLRESEERFRNVVETANEGVWMIDRERRATYVNSRMASMLGYDADEMIGRSLFEFTDDEGRAFLGERLAKREAGASEQYEFPFKHRDGSDVWTIIHGTPLFDTSGTFIGSFAMVTDVTERRRSHDALIESESRYRSLADMMPALVTLSSPDGRIEYCNRQLLEYSGLSFAEVAEGAWRELLHPDDWRGSAAAWGRRIAAGEAMEGEVRVRRHDGAYRWHLGRLAPVRGADGALMMWIGAHVDIDDRRQAESGQELLSALGESLNASLEYDDTLRAIVDCCVPAFADYAAVYTREDDGSIARRVYRASDEPHAQMVQFPINPRSQEGAPRVIATGEAQLHETVTDDLLRDTASSDEHLEALRAVGFKSALIVPVLARGGVLGAISFSTSSSGRRYGARDLGTAREIARRAGLAIENARLYRDTQQTMDDLRRANAAKDEFLGLVSHELKTPITTIYGNAEVLRRRSTKIDDAMRTAAIEDMGREAERLHRIIDNLLVLARLERGHKVSAEPVLVRRVAQRLIDEHRQRFPMRRIELNADAPLTPVAGEPLYIEQVLRNLISNAEKYSPWDRRIDVSITTTDGELVLAVLDRGPGFGDGEEDLIFTPFYRSPRTSATASGVGIGLAVCKRLVEAQHGRVWARRRPDGGAEIGFALPIADEG